MDIVHRIIDNEGEEVEVVYATGDHARVTIDKLLVQDGHAGVLLTAAEGDNSFVCTYDFDESRTGSLDVYYGPERIRQFQHEGIIPHQSTRPDSQIVEINELK